MNVPRFLQTYLASYKLSSLDIRKDKDLIITEVLNKGDEKALIWLTKTYSKEDVKKVVSSPIRGVWFKTVLEYWLKVFGIKINKETFKKAIINLNS